MLVTKRISMRLGWGGSESCGGCHLSRIFLIVPDFRGLSRKIKIKIRDTECPGFLYMMSKICISVYLKPEPSELIVHTWRYFYIVFLCSRALLENAPGVFLNASLGAFFSRTERKKKLKKVQLSEKKRLTSGAFLTADQSQYAEIAHHRNEAPGL